MGLARGHDAARSGASPEAAGASILHVVLIKPSHYDARGYPLRWWRSAIPSNSLAAVHALVADAGRRGVPAPGVELRVTAIDETNARVDPARILRRIRREGGRALVGLVGVQSNQFPRARDLAEPFLQAGIPVCMGGFHVAGSLAMLDHTPPEIAEAAEAGISFFLGEGEGTEPGTSRLDAVLGDAWAGALKPRYDHADDMPSLEGAVVPHLPATEVERTIGRFSSFDLGRGCPFQCSFCTIINVQGRVSRFRTADDLERIVRANRAEGVSRFFLTDDNLARNRNWEVCLDRLIALREEGLKVKLQVQVDTLCHRIPGFIEKAVRAGVDEVFVGLENINPDNLAAVRKKQNRIEEYREMLMAWKQHPVVLMAGYILGFPNDTRESILRDVDTIKRSLPIDMLYFTYLTPLPGSEDHQRLSREGVWMDPDLNRYDLNHRVTHHPRMSDAEWEAAYEEAWARFYASDHMETIIRRMAALGSNKKRVTTNRLLAYREMHRLYGCHPLEGGIVRVNAPGERRASLPRENALAFHARHWTTELVRQARLWGSLYRLRRTLARVLADPDRRHYTDEAIRPLEAGGEEAFLAATRGGEAEAARRARQRVVIASARADATGGSAGAKAGSGGIEPGKIEPGRIDAGTGAAMPARAVDLEPAE